MLGVARDEWERAGYQVRGAALSGIAAEGLEGGPGIQSRTIASMEYQWGQGRELLGPRDVLEIDEAGMLGTRQMERVLSEAERAGAKIGRAQVCTPSLMRLSYAVFCLKKKNHRHSQYTRS